ncbi:uncharacterized protein B0I36DRAFT_315111 [Microdochium trichocladiopsis]|uniref:Uncharacterized protein n=1 Tax=Microdochium trichocladiopsis TaxID=1682393 RepID=A0A9P9BUS6_9PEZI|nr:uncharacterized protein B0I36DRAFT_315111 [Microdochium trichocladiopsis]KAH7037946.1 hypothetical protein B0I36DRAFT_315111 [Microdochium trichocladiopsis]
MSVETTLSASATQPSPSYDWSLQALEMRNGQVIPLYQASAHFSPTANSSSARQIDDVDYLIGEAYILPSNSIVLMHTASHLATTSRLYRFSETIQKFLWTTSPLFARMEQFIYNCAQKAATKLPWSSSLLERRSPSSSKTLTPLQRHQSFRRSLYRLSRWFRLSRLQGMLQRFHAESAYLSIAELARLPRKSSLLERDIREKLMDGSWGLLVVNRKTCLVVEWHIGDDQAASRDSDEICCKVNEPRTCYRVGLLEYRHFLESGPEVDQDTSRIFSRAGRICFRLG